eukprot:1494192-Amphidinium_carterae.1
MSAMCLNRCSLPGLTALHVSSSHCDTSSCYSAVNRPWTVLHLFFDMQDNKCFSEETIPVVDSVVLQALIILQVTGKLTKRLHIHVNCSRTLLLPNHEFQQQMM